MQEQELRDTLCCPLDSGSLAYESNSDRLTCGVCGAAYPMVEGIPVLLPSAILGKQEKDSYARHAKTETETVDFYNDFYKNSNDYIRYNSADRVFVRRILPHIGIKPGARILDIGAGTAYFGHLIEQELGHQIHSTDFSIEGFRTARQHYKQENLTVMDAYDLGYRDETFDAVFAMGLTPYKKDKLEDVADLTSKIARVIKPGGHLVFVFSTNLRGVVHGNTRVDITDKNRNMVSTYYNHTREFITTAFEHAKCFSSVEGFVFIRPAAAFFGPYLLSRPVTLATEFAIRLLPPSLSARLVVIGRRL